MAYKGLWEFISILEKENELIRIKEKVSTYLEITEITDRISKSNLQNKALLFENNETGFPVLVNAMGSYKRMCLALRVDNLDQIGIEIKSIFNSLTSPKNSVFEKLKMLPSLNKFSAWMPKVIRGKGKCQEVIEVNPDLSKLPILTCWPFDGGPFITLPSVHTKDPETGTRNVGMYRMQIFDKKTTGMHWHMHKTGAKHFRLYKEKGMKMPVAVSLGGDPANTYSATAPLPDPVDEYLLAGFLRKKKVELVKCITQDIEVPSDADFVIEGYVDPSEELILEGPFGDHTGFYSLEDYYPKFHVTCITHRKDAVYPATVVGIPPQEDAWIGKATERIFLAPIQLTMLPELTDMNLPFEGVAHNIAIVKLKSEFPGHARKIMNTLWGAGQMMFNKLLLVLPDEININDYYEVAKCICGNVDINRDIVFNQGPLDVLDHSSSNFAFGGKMGIDATGINKKEIIPISKEEIHSLKTKISEIHEINTDLPVSGIPVLIVSLKDEGSFDIKELSEKILGEIDGTIRFLFYCDNQVEIEDIIMFTWLLTGNTDPVRDHFICNHKLNPVLVLDGRRKLNHDYFKRPWPNILVMNGEHIDLVNNKWKNYGLGDFIESPTLKYRKLIISGKETQEKIK